MMFKRLTFLLSACLATGCSDSNDSSDANISSGDGYSIQYLSRVVDNSNCSRPIHYAHVSILELGTDTVLDPTDYNITVTGGESCRPKANIADLGSRKGFYISVSFDPDAARFQPGAGSNGVSGECKLVVSVQPNGQPEREIPIGNPSFRVDRNQCR